jgi:hypothetical protein
LIISAFNISTVSHGNTLLINPVAISFKSEQRLSDAGNKKMHPVKENSEINLVTDG